MESLEWMERALKDVILEIGPVTGHIVKVGGR